MNDENRVVPEASALLKQFYREINAWVKSGRPEHPAFRARNALCENLWCYGLHVYKELGVFVNAMYDSMNQLEELIRHDFVEFLGIRRPDQENGVTDYELDVILSFPFNVSMDNVSARDACASFHAEDSITLWTNPRRLAFVQWAVERSAA